MSDEKPWEVRELINIEIGDKQGMPESVVIKYGEY